MEIPSVLSIDVVPLSNSTVIRSVKMKEYFSKLTSNVEVLYPTQVHCGLLLCKSKRTEEKILNMRHVLPGGSTIHLSHLPRPLFLQVKCLISGQTMQISEISKLIHQCLPFLHASDGKIQVNSDKSILLEGHILIINAVHCFLLNKLSKQQTLNNNSLSKPLIIFSGNIVVKVMRGKLIEQNTESIIIPISSRFKIHNAFEVQLQSIGGINIINYFKDLSTKGTRSSEGDVIIMQNQDVKLPIKLFIFFTVPHISNNEISKDKSIADSFQLIFEQKLYRALQTSEQNGVTNLAMPILEPSIKSSCDKFNAIDMTVCVMISAIRQYSQNTSSKIQRITIVDRDAQIKRMQKCLKLHVNQSQVEVTNSEDVDLNTDSGKSFAYIFGVPRIREVLTSSSDSDDNQEPDDYQHPYKHHVKF